MKKIILSFALVAVGLLLGVQAHAQAYVTYSDYDALLTAVDNANATEGTLYVKLGAPLSGSQKPLAIAGATVNLDLNGQSLTSTYGPTIVLVKGTLNVMGQGSIINSYENPKSSTAGDYYSINEYNNAIYVFGSDNASAVNYSVLNIGEKVLVKSNKGRGIHIQDAAGVLRIPYYKSDSEKYNSTAASLYTNTYNNAKSRPAKKCAYGVNVSVEGTVDAFLYGVQVSGAVNQKPASASTDLAPFPHITIGEKAVVKAADEPIAQGTATKDNVTYLTYKFGTGVYISGWAVCTIKGEVSGNNAVYAKGGNILIDGAQLTATGEANATVGKNGTLENLGGKASDSGTSGGGSALVIQSESGWAGETSVTVQGDAVLSSEQGNAVQETIAPASESQVTVINFVSGTFIAEEENVPAVTITNETKGTVIVDGGTFSSGGVEDPEKTGVADIIDENIYVLTPVSEGYVVSKLPEGFNLKHTLDGADEKSYVEFRNGYEDDFNETVSGDAVAAYIQIDCRGTITIPTGASLTVEEIAFSYNADDAVIIVEPGAKLLITGNKGFVNSNYNQLLIKANETASGSFVFSPAVMANKTPYATVEYVSETMCIAGSDYKFDIICSPFYKIDAISVSSASYFQMINESGAWEYVNKASVIANAKAFDAIAIANIRTAGQPKPVYTMKGRLQGNISGHIELKKGFNYYGNGFIANLNAKQVINAIVASGAPVRTLLYLWNTGDMRYEVKTYRQLDELDDLGAMKMFVLYADEDAEIDLDYNALIWNGNHE